MKNNLHIQTKAIHSNTPNSSNSIVQPIELSTTFERNNDGTTSEFIYTRANNPNRQTLENKIANLENAADAIAFSSGMAAINALFENILEINSHIIIPNDCYHGTRALLSKFFTKWNISFSEIEMTNINEIENAIKQNTKLIWIETPSNPQLKITDIKAVVNIAQAKKILVACDNTFATSILQNPLAMGADYVMHSSTKFFSGHSDILGGVVLAKVKNETTNLIRAYQQTAGAVPSPFDCWLLNRSIATFGIRVPIQNSNANQIASYLNPHPKIEKVYYPGLATHKNHDIAASQMIGGFGSILSVLVKGDEKAALKLASSFNLIKHATSLGGVESLVEHRRSVEGDNPISPNNLLRFSIGIEHISDLINDIENGLNQI
jgi:cystathionine gamma-synthase